MPDPVPTPVNDTKPRRRVLRLVGVGLVLVGVVTLGWVAWQMVGTNVISHHRQQQTIADIRQRWATTPATGSPTNASRRTFDPDTATGATRGIPVDPASDGAILRIPRFGADWEMPILDNVSEDSLASGVGHFPGTANVGQPGNYALAAHRVTHGEPFRNLPELRADDKVIVETRTTTYTYVLDTNGTQYTVPFTDNWVLGDRPIPLPSDRVITLVTCSELFHTDNRFVVFGHLLSTSPNQS